MGRWKMNRSLSVTGSLRDHSRMNAKQLDLERRIAEAMMAHALAVSAIESRFGGSADDRAERRASLDAVLAEQLASLNVDAETMAGAMARLALELASRTARSVDDTPAVRNRSLSTRSVR